MKRRYHTGSEGGKANQRAEQRPEALSARLTQPGKPARSVPLPVPENVPSHAQLGFGAGDERGQSCQGPRRRKGKSGRRGREENAALQIRHAHAGADWQWVGGRRAGRMGREGAGWLVQGWGPASERWAAGVPFRVGSARRPMAGWRWPVQCCDGRSVVVGPARVPWTWAGYFPEQTYKYIHTSMTFRLSGSMKATS